MAEKRAVYQCPGCNSYTEAEPKAVTVRQWTAGPEGKPAWVESEQFGCAQCENRFQTVEDRKAAAE
jgi:hypothetical protein